MARCIFFEKPWLTILLFVCVCFVHAQSNEGKTDDKLSDNDKSVVDETIPYEGESDVIVNSDEFPLDSNAHDNEQSSISETNTNNGQFDEISEKDESIVYDDFSEIDEVSIADNSIPNDIRENLINGQSVDIVNTFNIDDFGDGKSNEELIDAEINEHKNVTTKSASCPKVTVSTTTNVTGVVNNSMDTNLNNTNTSKPAIRWPCKPYTILASNDSLSPSVVIINNETTLGNVIASMNGTKECGVMLFYSPYCEFCTNLAPLYNAVGRSYNNLVVMASDAQKVMGMSARYGIVGIPTILLFYSGKAVAKYNRSRTVADFKEFVLELTGLFPTIPLNITSEDEVGPLSTTPKESRDYYLIFSITFMVIFLVTKLLGTCLKTSFINCFDRLKSMFKREKVD